MSQRVITFLSDFGTRDAYVAQVKGRLLSLLPDAVIVDITHEVRAYEILSAAWLLYTSYPYFPPDTLHLCVVDPGVGSSRAVLVVRKGGHCFVGPDNGVFSFLFPADSVMEIDWWPKGPVSPTFHGRDVFAPLVAELSRGAGPESLGHALANPVCLNLSKDMVVHVDRFGTLVTNISCSRLTPGCILRAGGAVIGTIARTFSDLPPGGLGLICGSGGTIEIAANRGSAAHLLNARVGMEVLLEEGSQRE